jgi:UrcA family protein
MQILRTGIAFLALAISSGPACVSAFGQGADSIVTANRADVRTARVSFREINLSTEQGVTLLRKKVRTVAADLCEEMSADYVFSSNGQMNCYFGAMAGAEPQIALAAKHYGNPAYATAATHSILLAVRP